MSKSSKPAAEKAKSTKPRSKHATASTATNARSHKSASKQDQMLDLLRRKQGVTLNELLKASGWQAHSVRGFLAGTVKKRLGLTLTSDNLKDGERHYAIP